MAWTAAGTGIADAGSAVRPGAAPAHSAGRSRWCRLPVARSSTVKGDVMSGEAIPPTPALPHYPRPETMVSAAAGQALVIRGLTKVYDGRAVVDHIDLDVPAGSFFGLVGPNGAGKTTTLSMVTGLLRPDGGRIVLAGVDVWADPVAAKSKMGVLPDGLRLFERLSGPELLSYLGRLRGLPVDMVNARARELVTVLDLDEAGSKLVADYSTGMRKKITLAAALLHAPPILLL